MYWVEFLRGYLFHVCLVCFLCWCFICFMIGLSTLHTVVLSKIWLICFAKQFHVSVKNWYHLNLWLIDALQYLDTKYVQCMGYTPPPSSLIANDLRINAQNGKKHNIPKIVFAHDRRKTFTYYHQHFLCILKVNKKGKFLHCTYICQRKLSCFPIIWNVCLVWSFLFSRKCLEN